MIAVILCIILAVFPERALEGAGMGLDICLRAVIPSLLPFMLVSSMAVAGGWGERLGRRLSAVLKPLFGIDGASSMCLVTGLLGGYPCGARAAVQCVEEGLMTKRAAERTLAYCNNSGPLFIIGTAGAAVYGSTKIGALLYVCHIIGALTAALIFGRGGSSAQAGGRVKKKVPFGALAGNAARDSGTAIVSVCAMVITFSAVIQALELYQYPILTGLLEVSRGITELGSWGAAGLPVAAACLSWGGLSVHFQTEAVCPGLSKKFYYAGKLISAAASGTAMYICVKTGLIA